MMKIMFIFNRGNKVIGRGLAKLDEQWQQTAVAVILSK